MQFCFMTTLLMTWQVIPANFVVFYNQYNFCHPQDHMLPRVKIIIIIGYAIVAHVTHAFVCFHVSAEVGYRFVTWKQLAWKIFCCACYLWPWLIWRLKVTVYWVQCTLLNVDRFVIIYIVCDGQAPVLDLPKTAWRTMGKGHFGDRTLAFGHAQTYIHTPV